MSTKDTVFTDVPLFKKYCEEHHFPNQFDGVMMITKEARELMIAFPDLTEKESISWALRGYPNETFLQRQKERKTRETISNMKFDLLCYVDDDNVRESCERSINKSLEYRRPTFLYNDDLNENQKARVRIITKLTLNQKNKESRE